MKPFSLFGLTGNLRGRQSKRKPSGRRLAAERLLLEELENRTLLSVIPPVTASTPGVLAGSNFVGVNPVVAADPANPNKLFEANLIGGLDPNTNAFVTDLTIQANFSVDGGAHFNGTTSPILLTDPLATTVTGGVKFFDVTGGPSVAFDTLNNVYLIYTEHNTANTSGVVLLNKYNFSGSSPTVVFTGHVLYQWINQDPAENPVVAVDTNQASFADPQAPDEVQTDPLAATVTRTINGQSVTSPSAVYVAWNVQQTQPFQAVPAVLNKILVEASGDGGMTFGTQEYLAGSNSNSFGGSNILQFLASYTVGPEGSPLGAATGTFYNDPREAGHDLVYVNDSAIVTSLISQFGTVIQSSATTLPAGATPIAFAAGNFTSDAFTDVAVVLNESGNFFLDIFTSDQNGTFTLGQSISLSGTPNTIVAGEFDAKNNLRVDLAIGDVSAAGNGEIQVFLNNGAATFTKVSTNFPTSLNDGAAVPVSLGVGDFNVKNNSFESIVVANRGSNDVTILTGNGDGTFNTPTAGGTVGGLSNPLSIAVADFNNDGVPDVAIVSNSNGTNGTGVVALGNGDGTFNLSALSSFGVTAGAVSVAVGDFAGDGDESIVTADVTPNTGSKLTVDGGLGTGAFAPSFTFTPTGVSPFIAMVTADVNGDGKTDLITVNGNSSAGNVVIYSGFVPGSTGGEAEGAAPQILFTQGTPAVGGATPRVPGGELIFVFNGASYDPVLKTEVFDTINTNISQPTGSNPLAPTPAAASDLFFGVGGSLADASTVGNTKIPGVTDFTISNINISDPQFTTLADLSIALNLVEPSLANVAIALVLPPGLASEIGLSEIPLINSSVNAAGQSTGDGISGANLGIVNYSDGSGGEFLQPTGPTQFDSGTDSFVTDAGGTVFQANAERSITDKGVTVPYVGVFQPEGEGSLQALLKAKLTPADLAGNWKLEITDFTQNAQNLPPEHLLGWSLNFTSDVSTTGFGATRQVVGSASLPGSPSPGLVLGGAAGVYPQVTTDSGPLGVGPGIAVAVDNTLGAFSPYQGRIYLAYNVFVAGGATPPQTTNVVLEYSDTNGNSWVNVGAITDDSAADGFSEGDRPKFDPSLTVDPVTGTVIITYYDGRYDPSFVRVANAMQTSIDGGETWSTSTFINELNTATNFLTGDSVTIEPIPGNALQSTVVGFGDEGASVVAFAGHVVTVFASNLNSSGSEIFVSQGTFADGPRVIQGDEGPVTHDSTTAGGLTISYNNSFASDGTRQLTGFVITFDRPVDALGFIANMNADVQIMFRSPTTPASAPGISLQVGGITALDFEDTNGLPGIAVDNVMATSFLISLATPASMVGTYSYAIGPMVSDRIRSKTGNGSTVLGTPMDQDANGTPGQPTDAFANPQPLNGIPFQLPYNTNTEPLIIPGPHVIFTYTAGATPPTAAEVDAIEDGTIQQTANVIVDNSASSIYILFDRNMDPTTFNNGSAVLSFVGPNGPISGPYTITADPPGTDPALAARTFLVSFPTQKLSGTYTLEFAPTAKDTLGNAVDTNLNAGLYVLEGSDPTNSTPTVSTYTASQPVTILPGQTVVSQLSISDAYLIEQDATHHIQVQLNIQYPNDPDLEASLIAPDGTVIPLFTNVGTFGAPPHSNFQNTIFDDFATTPIQQASVPFNLGPFNPQEPLSTLVGTGSEGVWKLAITDVNTSSPGGAAQLTYWSLSLPHTTPGTGLGEAQADRIPVSFQIFTQSPTVAVSSTSYSSIGPADENGLLYDPATKQYDIVSPNADAGQVNAIAVDPSDPSGNTVYVGGSTGGIWKTTDFLTTNPNGPTWIPLANFGPTNSLNISSLAVFGVNDNPEQSIIFAITGNSSQYGAENFPANPAAGQYMSGVGVLRSTDGGKTWEVLDGLNNVGSNGTILPIQSPSRDHTFDGDVGFKIVVDPHLLPGGNVAVYAAFSGPNGGLYRSLDSGNTWTLMMSGNCTDVTLAPGSTDSNGNEEILYAAFQGSSKGSGVFMTTSALTTDSLNLMAGDQGVQTRVDSTTLNPLPVANDKLSPNNQGGRIVLATPDLTSSPLQNTFYQGWLYAAVVSSSGTVTLYLTKDFGNNWTLVNMSSPSDDYGTNNTKDPGYDVAGHLFAGPQGNYDIALAIDPVNPDVVYLAGTANGANGSPNGLIRIDTSKLLDVYAEVPYLNSAPDGGQIETDTTTVSGDQLLVPGDPSGIINVYTGDLDESNGSTAYLNLYRDPDNPFVNPSTTHYSDVMQFNNVGTGAVYTSFYGIADGSTNFHALVTMVDPTTGTTRVLVGDDDGVFSGVDDGSGNLDPGDGFATAPSGTRNGNLALAEFSSGTDQPSTLSAQITGALYYGIGPQIGAAQSDPNILSNGDLKWQGVINSGGTYIEADPTGSGTLYQYRIPGLLGLQKPFGPTDFFLVTPVTAGQPPSIITSRTSGLLLNGDSPSMGTGEWPLGSGFTFAVNPIDPTAIVISSSNGNIFRTSGSSTGTGQEWFLIGKGSTLDNSSNAQALAFGAPDPSQPAVLDDFIYAGTADGHIYVTTNGGGSWTNISNNLDGSAVQEIVTDPRRGSHDAYAVTLDGVYYMADSTAPGASWVNVTGSLFSLTRGNYGNSSDPITTLAYLTSIAADWRYAIPDNPSDPTGPTHPVLYVAGNGGVFRSLDQGTTWTYYPDVTLDSAVTEGGLLPNVPVTGLNLDLGSINPATGFPNTSSGLNQLVVTTYGQGDFAIRLDPNAMVNGHPLSFYLDQPKPAAAVASISEIIPIPGTALTGIQVTFSGPIDPTTFTLSQIDSLKNPNGAQVKIASIVNATPAPPSGQASENNVYDIIFNTPQTTTGNYTLTIGPDITDDSGDPMAQDFTGVLFFTPDTAPTITPNPPADQVVAPGGSDVVHFTVGSAQYPNSLGVTVGSSNTSLLPVSDLTLSNTGDNYSLTITPPAGTTTGQSMVTITVTDPQTLQTQATFNVIVDEAPTLPPINGNNVITMPHNQFPYTGPLNATGFANQSLTFTATVSGDSLLYDLQQQYQFQGLGYVTAGATAYVLHSNQAGSGVMGYYLLRPSDGALFAYDGSGSYSHTFANGTPIATLGASVFTDPTQLLNAQPPVDYTTLYNLEQQYQFTGIGYVTAGATAYVLHSTQPGTGVGGYYLLRPSDGALFAYDGSGSYSHTFANGTPIATLGANLYTHPGELTNAQAAPSLYATLNQLNQQYDLQELGGSFYTNTYGHQAKWVYSPILNQFGQHWYTLTLQTVNASQEAVLTAWEGYQDSEVGAVIADLDPSVYTNPALLTTATAIPDPAVTASVDGSGNLMISLPNSNYVGTFKVTVTASDGLLSSSQTATVTSTDTASVITVNNGATTIPQGGTQSEEHLSFPVTDTVGVTNADNDTSTTSASAVSYSLPFALQQQYQFKGVGYVTAGATAYVLQADQNNSFGNSYYLLSSAGGLYAYDGSGSYSHTFANVTPLATFSASFYTDPTLLLNAQAPTNYSNLYNLMQQYQFTGLGYITAGATAYVLHSNSSGPGVGGYYLLIANGSLYAYDGSGSYATTIANSANLVATVEPAVYANPAILLGATASPGLYPQLYQDEQTFDLQEMGGSFYTGYLGTGPQSYAAKWLYSPIPNSDGQHWYTLVLSADQTQALLYAWDGGSSAVPNNATPVAVLDPTIYFNPSELLNAKSPTASSGVQASINGGSLTINAPANFVGTFQVTVTANDGVQNSTRTFLVQSNDTAPVPGTIGPQSVSRAGSPAIPLSSTDAENDGVTYTAQAVGYSPAYNYQQIYQFTGVGYETVGGVTAYVLHSNVLGGVGGYYLLKSDGGLYAYDGSGSFAHTFGNANNLITTLDPTVYTTPTLLTNAQAPTAPGAVLSITSGNQLSINVSSLPIGTVFEVLVTASDGAETTRTGFLVTVTA